MNSILGVFVGLRRNFAMAFASIVLILLTLLLLGFALAITINTKHISNSIKEGLKMTAYVKVDATESEIQDTIIAIEGFDGVINVELSDKEEELQNVTSAIDQGNLIADYFSGEANPLKDVLKVSVSKSVDMNSLKSEIESIDTIDSADYGEDFGADNLIKGMNMISFGAILVSAVFAIVTMILITNTIKLTINSRRKEIEIMRLVGATKGYITIPFAFEGALLGFIGGIISFTVVYSVYGGVYNIFPHELLNGIITPEYLLTYLIIGQIIFGLLIGLVGAIIAIRNYLKV
ncbi:MAG: permease-like cell division protein FtsX [Mycoplasmatales bacterium]